MAVITQNYDIDLKPTGERPVVKMSQFDTGSRTIVFTVYDGHELAHIDGCVARVDGTRSDGVEFSVSCTVGTGSKVSFTISQEMTKHAGKHAAELVIFDASGNPVGTQNFIIEVEAAPMVRDSAASADDRTLYDQYTDSVEQKFSSLSTSLTDTLTAKTDTLIAKTDALTKTVQDIDALLGGSSTAQTIINQNVTLTLSGRKNECNVTLTYDPISGLVVLNVSSQSGIVGVPAGSHDVPVLTIPTEYLPADDKYIGSNESDVRRYVCAYDGLVTDGTTSNWGVAYCLKENGQLFLRFKMVGSTDSNYEIGCSASWQARGGRYMGVNPIPTGSNTVTVGTTTTVDGGSEASVTNSGTAKDVVLDFSIPTQSFEGEGEESISISAKGDASSAGRNAIAIGKNASANYNHSVVIGQHAKDIYKGSGTSCTIIGSGAMGALSAVSIGAGSGTNNGSPVECHGVSVGNESEGLSGHSTAVGHHAKALGSDKYNTTGSDAFGEQAVARASGAVAIGFSSVADEEDTVSVGGAKSIIKARRIVHVADPVNAQDAATKAYVDTHAASGGYTLPAATATTLGGIKIGSNLTITDDGTLSATGGESSSYTLPAATSSTLGGVKVGAGLTATTDGTLSTTVSQSLNRANSALAIGDGGTTATGGAAMAVGLGATASAGNAAAVGQAAAAKGDSSLAVGSSATASDSQGTSIGVRAIATGWSTAIGSEASVSNAMASDAFGCKSSATAGHAVALGASSVADTEWSVSVGNSSNTRRIVNVTDPQNSQDAATKAYVDALIAKLKADNNLN